MVPWLYQYAPLPLFSLHKRLWKRFVISIENIRSTFRDRSVQIFQQESMARGDRIIRAHWIPKRVAILEVCVPACSTINGIIMLLW